MSTNPVFKAGNVAVITGGASGIGLALTSKCVCYGMKVFIVDNNRSGLFAAQSHFKNNVTIVEMDVSKPEDFEKLKKQIETESGSKYIAASSSQSVNLALKLKNLLSTSSITYLIFADRYPKVKLTFSPLMPA